MASRWAASAIECRTVLWAAGVIASPAAKWLDAAHDRAGRIMVTPQLTVPGQPDVYAIGDTARWHARRRPGAGHRTRRQADGCLCRPADRRAHLRGGRVERPFRYRHQGNLATIGRKAAVADLGWIKLSGFPAWMLWALAHVWFLIGWRNRFVVALNWMWSYVTFERGARLITGVGPGEPTRCVARPSSQPEDVQDGHDAAGQARPDARRAGAASLDPADREILLPTPSSGCGCCSWPSTALAVGDLLPEFTLPDTDGDVVSSNALLARGPLVAAFVRGPWCPYCSLALAGAGRGQAGDRAAGCYAGGDLADPRRRAAAGGRPSAACACGC